MSSNFNRGDRKTSTTPSGTPPPPYSFIDPELSDENSDPLKIDHPIEESHETILRRPLGVTGPPSEFYEPPFLNSHLHSPSYPESSADQPLLPQTPFLQSVYDCLADDLDVNYDDFLSSLSSDSLNEYSSTLEVSPVSEFEDENCPTESYSAKSSTSRWYDRFDQYEAKIAEEQRSNEPQPQPRMDPVTDSSAIDRLLCEYLTLEELNSQSQELDSINTYLYKEKPNQPPDSNFSTDPCWILRSQYPTPSQFDDFPKPLQEIPEEDDFAKQTDNPSPQQYLNPPQSSDTSESNSISTNPWKSDASNTFKQKPHSNENFSNLPANIRLYYECLGTPRLSSEISHLIHTPLEEVSDSILSAALTPDYILQCNLPDQSSQPQQQSLQQNITSHSQCSEEFGTSNSSQEKLFQGKVTDVPIKKNSDLNQLNSSLHKDVPQPPPKSASPSKPTIPTDKLQQARSSDSLKELHLNIPFTNRQCNVTDSSQPALTPENFNQLNKRKETTPESLLKDELPELPLNIPFPNQQCKRTEISQSVLTLEDVHKSTTKDTSQENLLKGEQLDIPFPTNVVKTSQPALTSENFNEPTTQKENILEGGGLPELQIDIPFPDQQCSLIEISQPALKSENDKPTTQKETKKENILKDRIPELQLDLPFSNQPLNQPYNEADILQANQKPESSNKSNSLMTLNYTPTFKNILAKCIRSTQKAAGILQSNPTSKTPSVSAIAKTLRREDLLKQNPAEMQSTLQTSEKPRKTKELSLAPNPRGPSSGMQDFKLQDLENAVKRLQLELLTETPECPAIIDHLNPVYYTTSTSAPRLQRIASDDEATDDKFEISLPFFSKKK